jgi:ABC-type sugar transport system permease subunit
MKYAQVGAFSGLANYKTLLTDVSFWHSVWISTVFILIAEERKCKNTLS